MEDRYPNRVAIKGIQPQIEEGRFPVKRVIGQEVEVEADVFADGHDSLAVFLLYRHNDDQEWNEIPMKFLVNDRWQSSFRVEQTGIYKYRISAWIDSYKTWRNDFLKRVQAGQTDLETDLAIGINMMAEASQKASGTDNQLLQRSIKSLQSKAPPINDKLELD